MDLPTEEWRPVPGFIKYQVSNLGRFRNAESGRVITKRVHRRNGYLWVKFSLGGRGNQRSVRTTTLIAKVWLPPKPSPSHQVDHVNGDKHDERVSNLEWVTQSENVQRSFDKGQHPHRPGVTVYYSKETHEEVKRLWAAGFSQIKIAAMMKERDYPMDNSTVSKIVNGKTRPRSFA